MNRYLLLAASYPPEKGGIANYLFNLTKVLPDVKVMTLKSTSAITPGEFNHGAIIQVAPWFKGTVNSHFFILTIFSYLWNLFKYRRDFDQIICGQGHIVLLTAAFFFKIISNKEYFVIIHGLDFLSSIKKRYKSTFLLFLNNAKKIVVNSESTLKIIQKHLRPEISIDVLYPFIDDNFTLLQKQHSSQAHQERIKILTVGRLVERKGIDTVIQALSLVRKTNSNFIYQIVGEGPYRSELQKLVNNLQMDQFVEFLGKQEDVHQYYKNCDIFVMVSRVLGSGEDIEGFGIVFLEAGMYKKPVVGSRCGGIPEIIVDMENGLLVDQQNIVGLSEAIVKLINDKHLRDFLGNNGILRVQKLFSCSASKPKVMRIFCE